MARIYGFVFLVIGIKMLDGFAQYFMILPVFLLAHFATIFNCLVSLSLPKHLISFLNLPATITLMGLLGLFSYSLSLGNS